MRNYKASGIIIKRKDFGEADRLLTIFTRHYGKIKAIAKGIRKINSKRGGNLELFNVINVYLTQGRNFEIVTEVEVKETFHRIQKKLVKIGEAYHICELIDSITGEGQEHDGLYDLLRLTLEKLDRIDSQNRNDISLIVTKFEEEMLKELGYWPRNKPVGDLDTNKYIENLLEKKLKSTRILNLIS